ncbi:hypothetical protein ACWGI8_30670 [Streptomyces sp. NPDC054841]
MTAALPCTAGLAPVAVAGTPAAATAAATPVAPVAPVASRVDGGLALTPPMGFNN